MHASCGGQAFCTNHSVRSPSPTPHCHSCSKWDCVNVKLWNTLTSFQLLHSFEPLFGESLRLIEDIHNEWLFRKGYWVQLCNKQPVIIVFSSFQWFWNSIQIEVCADENLYRFERVTSFCLCVSFENACGFCICSFCCWTFKEGTVHLFQSLAGTPSSTKDRTPKTLSGNNKSRKRKRLRENLAQLVADGDVDSPLLNKRCSNENTRFSFGASFLDVTAESGNTPTGKFYRVRECADGQTARSFDHQFLCFVGELLMLSSFQIKKTDRHLRPQKRAVPDIWLPPNFYRLKKIMLAFWPLCWRWQLFFRTNIS